MDTNAVAALATQMSQDRLAEGVQVSVLKKAMDMEGQGALQLLQSAMQVAQVFNNPPHLGNRVDTFA